MDNKLLLGYSFVFTNFLHNNKKDFEYELKNIVLDNGGRVCSAVSSKTTFLVCYDNDMIETKKVIKAKEKNVNIINHHILNKFINGEEKIVDFIDNK